MGASQHNWVVPTALVPTPVISLGENFVLQHNRQDDFNTFINGSYTRSSRTEAGGLTQDGNTWANDFLKVGISFDKGNWEIFLSNKPMIFMEVLNQRGSKNNNKRMRESSWSHPVHFKGALNRSGTNYGGGDFYGLFTEWDLTINKPNAEQTIELNQQFLYRGSVTLPQRWVDFVVNSSNNLRYQRGWYLTPTDANGNRVVNTFVQPVRFRFGYIDTDGRSVILGEPSDTLYISPKWGYFKAQDDTYIYDWQIRFNK